MKKIAADSSFSTHIQLKKLRNLGKVKVETKERRKRKLKKLMFRFKMTPDLIY